MGNLRRMAGAPRSDGLKSVIAVIACWALILACAAPSQAQGWQTARKPQGVYAHVDLRFLINEFSKAYYKKHNLGTYESSCPPQAPPGSDAFLADLHAQLQKIYLELLRNSAVSGIAAGIHWCLLEPENGNYDWTWLEDVFNQAATANKNVQLHIVPGNDSPPWLVANDSQSCDQVLANGVPIASLADCVWATFKKLPENLQEPESYKLPLPWSGTYTFAWTGFLYGLEWEFFRQNPKFVPLFAAIAMAGPTSESDEMILPTSANGSKFPHGLDVDTGWTYLIQNSFPYGIYSQGWDWAFVDAWAVTTIPTYDTLFSGVTLLLIPDDGGNLPELSFPGNPPSLVQKLCANSDSHQDSCMAKATVVSGFFGNFRGKGANEKAAMAGGLTASSPTSNGDIGLPGVKLLTSMSMSMPPQSPRFLGGAQFDHRVSGASPDDDSLRIKEGCVCSDMFVCTMKTCSLNPDTPEQAAYNVLGNFFYGTIAAGHYGGQPFAAPYASPLHFLNMEYEDILYAKTSPCMQQLITQASLDLLATAGKSPLGSADLSSCGGLIAQ